MLYREGKKLFATFVANVHVGGFAYMIFKMPQRFLDFLHNISKKSKNVRISGWQATPGRFKPRLIMGDACWLMVGDFGAWFSGLIIVCV